jgi:hypothetical protein
MELSPVVFAGAIADGGGRVERAELEPVDEDWAAVLDGVCGCLGVAAEQADQLVGAVG